MSAPTLRFKEFESKVEVKKLGNISNIVVGFVGTVSDQYCDPNEGIPFVRTQNVREGYFSIENLEYVTKEFHKKNKKSQIFNGDVLIARVGANMGMVCAVENLNTEANCANVIIIKKNSQLNSQYLSLFLNSENGQKQIHSGGAGGAQAVFNTTLAKEISFPYFPLQEQTKIASFLSAVDEKISQLTQKHQLLSQYKQGMMQKLFSQQIRFKADDGSEFREWKIGKLGDITSIQGGFAFKSTNFGKGMTKVIRIGDIEKNINLDSFTGIYSNEIPDTRYLISENAIVMALSGATFGKLGKVNQGYAYINQRVATFKVFKDSLNEFLYQIMLSQEFTTYIQSIPSASAQPNISNQDVINFEMMIPCLEEQRWIRKFEQHL